MRVLRLFKIFYILLIFLVALIVWLSMRPNDDFVFDYFDNQEGHSSPIIPNIVHYVLFEQTEMDFTLFLSMTSVLKIHQPDYLIIHTSDELLENTYFRLIKLLANLTVSRLVLRELDPPSHVYGQPLSSVYHKSDVARIGLLMKYGGIYLDSDMVVLKPLDRFLHYEMVVAWPTSEFLGNQILIGHKEARFLKLWLSGYRTYKPRMWYYNAGQFPSEQILSARPGLVHRVHSQFGVQNLLRELYDSSDWDWSDYFALHLLSRHPPAPLGLDEKSVLKYNKTFGEIARWILYGVGPTLDVNSYPPRWEDS